MFLHLLHKVQNSLQKIEPVIPEWSQHSQNPVRIDHHAQVIMAKTVAFLSNCRHLQTPVQHYMVFNFLAYFQSSCFHWSSKAVIIFDRFSTPVELLRQVFNLVLRRCSITIHNQL